MNEITLARLRQADLMREVERARLISKARTGDRWWVRSVGRLEAWTRRRRRVPRLVLVGAQVARRER
ncbi:MAG TPA: hypothetical protein VGG05_04415 [Pseudonocardiaceae bacterium]|jgi:hypothetical protein